MARGITENTDAGQLGNHIVSKVSTIDHVPFDEHAAVKAQSHPPLPFTAVTNQLRCTRCGGLLVTDLYMHLDGIDESKFPPKRCVQCGEVVDSVILLNRQLRKDSMAIQLSGKTLPNNCVAEGR